MCKSISLLSVAFCVLAGCESRPPERLPTPVGLTAIEVDAEQVGAPLSAAPGPAYDRSYLDDPASAKTNGKVEISYEPLETFRSRNAEAAKNAAAGLASGQKSDGEAGSAAGHGGPKKPGIMSKMADSVRGLLGGAAPAAAGSGASDDKATSSEEDEDADDDTSEDADAADDEGADADDEAAADEDDSDDEAAADDDDSADDEEAADDDTDSSDDEDTAGDEDTGDEGSADDGDDEEGGDEDEEESDPDE